MAPQISSPRHFESGSGASVVLLDWTPWGSTALGAALAERYRVISVEPPGVVDPKVSLEKIAETCAAATTAESIDSYAVVATSLGADVALHMTLLNPARITTLVLVSPTCIGRVTSTAWSAPESAMTAMLAHPEDGSSSLPSPERVATLDSLSKIMAVDESDTLELLSGLSCATLAVFGQEDRVVSKEAGRVWKELVPNCSLSYVYDAGHAVGLDRPAALSGVVLDFLERRETFIVENRRGLINP